MIWEGEHCPNCEATQAENENLRHDLERQMTIANEYVNEAEVAKQELSDFEQRVSDIVYAYVHADGGPDDWEKLETLILPKPKPKPDPLVDVVEKVGLKIYNPERNWAGEIRATLDALGFEIRERGQ